MAIFQGCCYCDGLYDGLRYHKIMIRHQKTVASGSRALGHARAFVTMMVVLPIYRGRGLWKWIRRKAAYCYVLGAMGGKCFRARYNL